MADYYQPSQAGSSPAGPQSQDDTNTTMPVIQENQPFTKVDNKVNVQSSSGGGGGGIGSFLGPIGSILGGLFTEGGVVGFADGGQVGGDKNSALATGYLVGALHQKKYGGNPKTLPEAANKIKAMLQGGQGAGPQGLASGGTPIPNNNVQDSADQQLAMQALMKALGMDNGGGQNQASVASQNPGANPQANSQPPQQQPANVANGTQSMQQPSFGNSEAQVGGTPNPQRGYAMGGMPAKPPMMQPKGYAAGGADMMPPQGQPPMSDPNGQPPLQPGQQFQGDGSVKGPGGPQDDAIPAKLSNGEFVFSQPAVQFFGVDKLTQMNEKGKQGFAQAVGQVQQNQQQGPEGGPPGQPPATPPQASAQPPQQPPMMQAKGGAVMRAKGSGYCGL